MHKVSGTRCMNHSYSVRYLCIHHACSVRYLVQNACSVRYHVHPSYMQCQAPDALIMPSVSGTMCIHVHPCASISLQCQVPIASIMPAVPSTMFIHHACSVSYQVHPSCLQYQ